MAAGFFGRGSLSWSDHRGKFDNLLWLSWSTQKRRFSSEDVTKQRWRKAKSSNTNEPEFSSWTWKRQGTLSEHTMNWSSWVRKVVGMAASATVAVETLVVPRSGDQKTLYCWNSWFDDQLSISSCNQWSFSFILLWSDSTAATAAVSGYLKHSRSESPGFEQFSWNTPSIIIIGR